MGVGGIGQRFYQNNVSTGKHANGTAARFSPQKQAAEAAVSEGTKKNASVQDIYNDLKSRAANESVEEQCGLKDGADAGADDKKLTVWYKGKTLDEWALTSPKYTDAATGISWYVIDGTQPYMTGEDAEKFRKMCEESGEFPLKKFAQMTGAIQYLCDNTTAYEERAFAMVGANAPDHVKQAWMEAARESGVNGLGMAGNGILTHISKMMAQRLTNQLSGSGETNDLLGSTGQSAVRAVERALYDLDHPRSPESRKSMEVQRQQEKERVFYRSFLEKLGAAESAAKTKETNAFRPESSDEVMQAWDKALAKTGVNPFPMNRISTAFVLHVETGWQGFSSAFLGDSVDSAKWMTTKIINRLMNPLTPAADPAFARQELMFYNKFLEYLG